MRQFISVCGLFTRQTIFKVLAVLAGMSAIQFAFCFTRNDSLSNYFATSSSYALFKYLSNLSDDLDGCVRMHILPYEIVFLLAFLLLILLLCRSQYGSNVKPDLTLRRLAIKEKTIFFSQGLINTVWFLIFWIVEASVVFFLEKHYFNTVLPQDQAAFYTLQIFREYYFMLSLISPFNGALAAVLGLSLANYSLLHRHNQLGLYIALITGVTVFTFAKSYFPFVLLGMAVLTVGKIIFNFRHLGKEEIFKFKEDPEVIL